MTPASPALPLPPVAVWRVAWTALQPQTLRGLMTIDVHCAFDETVKRLCDPELYALCRSAPLPEGARGCTIHAPGAVVFAPENYDSSRPIINLDEGDTVVMRVTLVGQAALARQAELDAAIRSAGRRGMGTSRPDLKGRRLPMRYERLNPLVPARLSDSAGTTVLRMVMESPTHIVVDKKPLASLDAEGLWRAMVRRVDLLARAHGGTGAGVVLPREVPFEVTASETREVLVKYKGNINWPGLIGSVTLSGEGLSALGPLLDFVAQVGIGKHTSFGLGRVAFVAG